MVKRSDITQLTATVALVGAFTADITTGKIALGAMAFIAFTMSILQQKLEKENK